MATNITTVPQHKDENPERLINRFCKKYRESKLYEEVKNCEFYTSESEKRHASKRKHQHLNDIYKKIRKGKLKPRNKQLYRQIMEG